MTRPWFPYSALGLLLACAAWYYGENATYIFQTLKHPASVPAAPFSIRVATRTIGSGIFSGDEILQMNGRPFTSPRLIDEVVSRSRPGDKLDLVLSEPSGRAFETDVAIGSQLPNYGTSSRIALILCLNILIPLACLGPGFAAAFIRPRDRNAWLLLLLLAGLSGLVSRSVRYGWPPDPMLFRQAFWAATWPIWLLLFSIYFPRRFMADHRLPWLKYLVLAAVAGVELIYWGIVWVWSRDIDTARTWHALLTHLFTARLIIEATLVGAFFAILGVKSFTEVLPDDRRRIRILQTGALVSLTPMFLVTMYALTRGWGPFDGVPWPVSCVAFGATALFPLTLAYVVVVDRSPDLGFAVRQSMKYGLVWGGSWLVRAGSICLAIYVFSSHAGESARGMMLLASVAGLIVVRRKNTDRVSAWIDRRFFREAHKAEAALGDLAGEVARFPETDLPLKMVARRIAVTLRVPDIVILLRGGDVYQPRFSTRPGEPMDIAAGGRIAATLRERETPLEVYFDKPPDWIRSLDAMELQTLDHMRTKLLLPIPGEDRLAGIMSLGLRLSGETYSTTDKRLLQSVATRMGSRLKTAV